MSKIKELVETIILGKDYAEAFKSVMIEKIKELLEAKKIQIAESIFSENVEELDEISKETLGSYIKKASHDVATKGAITRHFGEKSERERKAGDYVNARKSMEKADNTFAKSWKRREGMAKAVDRLVKKEEVELDERELTDAEMKKREEIVKSMKKKKGEFEKRYGERAKEVMYATATKAAKGMSDSVEETGESLDEKFEKGRVDYFHTPEKEKKAAKRYSEVASMMKAKRQKPITKSNTTINSSYEEEQEVVEELTGDQHKLDHDKDGKIEASDLKKLRDKKKSAAKTSNCD